MMRIGFVFALLACLALGSQLDVTAAAMIQVDTYDDELNSDGDCSLREAIQAANADSPVDGCAAGSGDDVIHLPAGKYTITLDGSADDENLSGDFDLLSNVQILATGQGYATIDAQLKDRVFDVFPGANVVISGLYITGGVPNYSSREEGGGIYNAGTLSLFQCLVRENRTGLVSPGDGGGGGGIYNAGDLTIYQCTIADNLTEDGVSPGSWRDEPGDGGPGGGIYNAGTLKISNSALVRNRTGDGGSPAGNGLGGRGGNGGGLYNQSSAHLFNTTVSSNTTGNGAWGNCGEVQCSGSGGDGGGIFNAGELIIENSTITANVTGRKQDNTDDTSTNGGGGGLFGNASMRNTILAGNLATGYGLDCYSEALVSYGFNLVQHLDFCHSDGETADDFLGFDPGLAPLDAYGGLTPSHALLSESPAIDSSACTAISGDPIKEDQRGFARPWGSNCDIGAYERGFYFLMYMPLNVNR